MSAQPGLLHTASEISTLCEELKKHTIISFDTEFIRETTFYPMIEILQIATRDQSWILDGRKLKKDPEAAKPLLEIFQDPGILKIIHAAQGDQEVLYASFGIVATPSFDTAVAASLCGYGDSIGLANLLKAVLNVTIKKGHARTDWTVRPLPTQLIEYAHADVEHLVNAAEKLMTELDRLGRRPWALEQSAKWEDTSLYAPSPEEIALKLARNGRQDKRSFAALVELVKWREERVHKLNLPRRWVADDNVLVDLANVRPKDLAHLGAFRGLNKGELKNSGEAILAAIARASSVEEIELPRLPRPEIPSEAEAQVLELMKCYVGILADQHKIASKHLLTSAQFLPLLRSHATTVDELILEGILSQGAGRLIGEEVLALKAGQRALSIKGGRVSVVGV